MRSFCCFSPCLALLLALWLPLALPSAAMAAHFPPPTATSQWADFIGSGQLQAGDEVAFFDPQGVLCGLFTVTIAGQYGVLHVYADDPLTPSVDEGASNGDLLSVRIWDARAMREYAGSAVLLTPGTAIGSFVAASAPPIWTANASYVLNIAAQQAIQQTYRLTTGWNLVSFPMQLTANTPADLELAIRLAGGVLESVWFYDPLSQNWHHYSSLNPQAASLRLLEPGIGYWLKLSTGTSLTLSGTSVTNITPSLQAGWNLVGVSQTVNNINDWLTQHGASSVWSYRGGSWHSFHSTTPAYLNSLQSLTPGSGYYLKR